MSYSREETQRFRKAGDVTPNGVVFDWYLLGPDGAHFVLIRGPHHTAEDIAKAKAYLKRNRDVVGRIDVTDMEN